MPSKEYYDALELSKEHHGAHKTFSGKFLRPHALILKEQIIDPLGIRSALDYGCGKGKQYTWRNPEVDGTIPIGSTIEEYWGFPVTKYDPAYPPFAEEPTGTFDLVICTHVLTLIPVNDLHWVVSRLYAYADKALFIVNGLNNVPTKPRKAKQRTANMPGDWSTDDWIEFLKARKTKDILVHLCTKTADPANVKAGRFTF